jgi:GntR family transcriptional regulator / MocR family aminotransferase
MTKRLRLELDRPAKTPLGEQTRKPIRAAIESGVLAPGARLPAWLDSGQVCSAYRVPLIRVRVA